MSRFIHQYDEEYDGLKKARRPGRPATAREDLLKLKIAALEKEYQTGFGRFAVYCCFLCWQGVHTDNMQ